MCWTQYKSMSLSFNSDKICRSRTHWGMRSRRHSGWTFCSIFFQIFLFLFTMAPGQIPNKLGINASVSAALNYIQPTSHWKEVYHNSYRMKRLTFCVDGLEQDAAGKNVLKLFHAAYPDKIFTAYVFLCPAWETWTPKSILCQRLPHNIYEACKKGCRFSCTTSWWRRGRWANWRCSFWWWWRRQPRCLAPFTRRSK